jgi:hypothetical protein
MNECRVHQNPSLHAALVALPVEGTREATLVPRLATVLWPLFEFVRSGCTAMSLRTIRPTALFRVAIRWSSNCFTNVPHY